MESLRTVTAHKCHQTFYRQVSVQTSLVAILCVADVADENLLAQPTVNNSAVVSKVLLLFEHLSTAADPTLAGFQWDRVQLHGNPSSHVLR